MKQLQLNGHDELAKYHIKELLEPYQNRTMVELGANNGVDSIIFLATLDLARLISVEPDPRCIQKILNLPFDRRLVLVEAAIHETDGSGIFHICTATNPKDIHYGPHDLGSSLRHVKELLISTPWLTYEDILVPYVTLDTIFREFHIDTCDFIWSDIEGANREMINGGKEALKRTRYVYCEVDAQENYEGEMLFPELSEAMTALNFELVYQFKTDALYRNLRDGMSEVIEVT